MKKQTSISDRLGMTQQEIASLLGISRSLWSMYETGRRSLPTNAMLKLHELEHKTNVHSEKMNNEAAGNKGGGTVLHDATRKAFEHQLSEIQFRLHQLNRKIAAAEKKKETMTTLTHFSTVLADSEHSKKVTPLANWIATKADMAADRNPPVILDMLYHRKEILEYEIESLKTKLNVKS